MNVLIVSAHPEPRSLTNALRDTAAAQLSADGHTVRVTDLYAINWKSAADRADFPTLAPAQRLRVPQASGEAFATGTLTDDVVQEQEGLLWADALILAFPLWWFSMPAILKGGSTGSMPMVSPTVSASTATRVGATATERDASPESGPC